MDRTQPFFKPTRVLLLIAGIVLLSAALIFVIFPEAFVSETRADYKNIVAELSTLKDDNYHRYFVEHIDTLFREEGINGMIARVIDALTREQITMFVCHTLAHDIGHYGGYAENFGNIENHISKKNLDFCGSGFMHGVEAQLANEPYPQNKKDLYFFCRLVLPKDPYYSGCYHGAGHSFMENTRDPHEALAQCDLLKTDEYTGVSNCYRGVFSEHANIAYRQGKDSAYLLSFCNELPQNLQAYCAQELNGLEIPPDVTQAQIEEALKQCTSEAYTRIIQAGCVRSVAGTATDRLLGQGKVITAPPFLESLDTELKQTYIASTHGTFMKTSMYTGASLEPFCNSFSHAEDKIFCRTYSLAN